MTLIVETGSGLSNAESYASVAEADAYCTNLGLTAWTGVTADKEIALRKATTYLDATYAWVGEIYDDTQALGWPRVEAYDNEGRDLNYIVPSKIKAATIELAIKALTSELLSDTTSANFITKEKVGSLEVEYAPGAPTSTQYNIVGRMLNGYTNGQLGGATVKLNRV